MKFGFSKGCAELGPKKPPPLVPRCFMATKAATGPLLTSKWSPCKLVTLSFPSKVIGIPLKANNVATTIAIGNRILVQLLTK